MVTCCASARNNHRNFPPVITTTLIHSVCKRCLVTGSPPLSRTDTRTSALPASVTFSLDQHFFGTKFETLWFTCTRDFSDPHHVFGSDNARCAIAPGWAFELRVLWKHHQEKEQERLHAQDQSVLQEEVREEDQGLREEEDFGGRRKVSAGEGGPLAEEDKVRDFKTFLPQFQRFGNLHFH